MDSFIDVCTIHGLNDIHKSKGACRVMWVVVVVFMALICVTLSTIQMRKFLASPVYSQSFETYPSEDQPFTPPDVVYCYIRRRGIDFSRLPPYLQDNATCPRFARLRSAKGTQFRGWLCDYQAKEDVEIIRWHTSNWLQADGKVSGGRHVTCTRFLLLDSMLTVPGQNSNRYFRLRMMYMPVLAEQAWLTVLPTADPFSGFSELNSFRIGNSESPTFKIGKPIMSNLLDTSVGGSCFRPAGHGSYNAEGCIINCIIKGQQRKFGCFWPYNPIEPTYGDSISATCGHKSSFHEASLNCSLNCKPACKFWSYQATKESIEGDKSHQWEKFHGKLRKYLSPYWFNISDELNIDESTMNPYYSLTFIFPHCSKIQVKAEKVAMGPTDFVSSIGGILGLYLGVSAIGLIQVCAFTLQWLRRHVSRLLGSRSEVNDVKRPS